MSTAFTILTYLLLLIPVGIAWLAWQRFAPLARIATFFILIYASVWCWFRPSRFVIAGDHLCVQWPLREVRIPRATIVRVERLDRAALKARVGWGMRIGAGGLWGGFGLLKTERAGTIHLYVSQTCEFVWIDCGDQRPWLITPEDAAGFCRAVKTH